MNSPAQITCYENQGVTFMARMRTNGGAYITQAIFGTITVNVYSLEQTGIPPVTTYTNNYTISQVVYDTLQTTDPRWTVDSTGYNFAAYIPASAFPTGDITYQAEFKLTPTGGDPYHLVGQVQTENLLTGS